MKVGLTYDVAEDYGLPADDWTHADFSTPDGVAFVRAALERCGFEVVPLGNYEKTQRALNAGALRDVDIVLNTAEGIHSRNREGWIPSLLEMNGVPYVGTDAFGLGASLNKAHTKLLCRHLRVPTPEFFEINSEDDIPIALWQIGCPCVLKPNYEGSSSGLALIRSADAFAETARELLSKYGQTILCERYIDGREITVPILGTGASAHCLGVVETVRRDGAPIGVYAIEEKFTDVCEKVLPILAPGVAESAYRYALMLHNYLGCRDFNRADFRLDAQNRLYFLEMNPLPDLAEESSYPMCCALKGIPFHEALRAIIESALDRYRGEVRVQEAELVMA